MRRRNIFISACATPVRSTRRSLRRLRQAACAIESLEVRRLLSFMVTSLADDGGSGTLRSIVATADTDLGGNITITFDPSLTASGPATITLLSGSGPVNLDDVTGTLTIQGPTNAALTIDAQGNSSVFTVAKSTSAVINNLDITDGNAQGGSGGDIDNQGTLALNGCTISNGTATGMGGGIYNEYGELDLTDCTLAGNVAGTGGAIENDGQTLNITDCDFTSNSAGFGGAITNTGLNSASQGMMTVTDSTFLDNMATSQGTLDGGGAINQPVDMVSSLISDCTFNGNSSAGVGGAIFVANYGGVGVHYSLNIDNSTLTGNSAGVSSGGGGIYDHDAVTLVTNCTISANIGDGIFGDPTDDTSLYNTIVAGNFALDGTTADDVDGTIDAMASALGFTPSSNNLIGDGGSGGLTSANSNIILTSMQSAGLGSLQNNGGPTETMALLPGSPAINTGDIDFVPVTMNDQRGTGFFREIDGDVDIGAYQIQAGVATQLVYSTPTVVDSGNAVTFVVSVEDPYGNLVTDGSTVSVTLTDPTGTQIWSSSGVDSTGQVSLTTPTLTTAGTYTLSASDSADDIPATPTTFNFIPPLSTVVTNTNDSGTGSLRQAIANAETNGGDQTVTFDPTDFSTAQTITLTSGALELSDTSGQVTIQGLQDSSGNNLITVTGNALSSVFVVDSGVTAVLADLTITGGTPSVSTSNGGDIANAGTLSIESCNVTGGSLFILAFGDGGGVFNSGNLTVTNSTFSNNFAPNGGAIANQGVLSVSNTVFSGDSALVGGAIDDTGQVGNPNVSMTITDCSFLNNTADAYEDFAGDGGALEISSISAYADISGSTFSGNVAQDASATVLGSGAAIDLEDDANLYLVNSTLTGNTADGGGSGINNDIGFLTVVNCTIADNIGAGIASNTDPTSNEGDTKLNNSIVAGNITSSTNSTPSDVDIIDSPLDPASSNNLIGDGSGGLPTTPAGAPENGNILGTTAMPVDPDLGPLADNGVPTPPTQTMALLPGSPAIDAGDNALAVDASGNPLQYDQRGPGFARIVNGTVDIGAFEVQTAPVVSIVVTPPSAQGTTAGVSASFSLGSFTESGATAPYSVDVDWGDGSADTVFSMASAGTITAQNHTYASAGPDTVSITITDADDNVSNTATFGVTVAPAAVTSIVVTPPSDQTATAGVSQSFNLGSFTESDATAPYSVDVNWGDGSTDTVFSMTSPGTITPQNHTYASSGPDTVSVIITDADDNMSNTGTFGVNVTAASTAVPTQLAFIQNPTDTTAGQTITPSVTVAVEDQNGDVLNTDDTSSITLTFSGPGTLNGTLTETTNDGVATFTDLSDNTAGTGDTLQAADTGDGLSDIESTPFNITAAAPTQLVFSTGPTDTTAGTTMATVVVSIEDQFGNVEGGDNSPVTLSIASGPAGGSFTATSTTTVNAQKGVATFNNLTLDTPGQYTLAVSDASDDLAGFDSAPFNVTAASTGVASQLAFIQGPTDTTAGQTITPSVMVAVEDQNGNIVGTDDSYVTLRLISDDHGHPRLHGTLTVQAVDGIATFSDLSLTKAGTYMLEATDGSLSSATSSSFQITPAAATRMVFIGSPSSTRRGKDFDVEVELLDQYGNVATNDTSTVTLSLGRDGGGAVLSGTLTANVMNGIATFDNLSINKAGSFTLVATDSNSLPTAHEAISVTGRHSIFGHFHHRPRPQHNPPCETESHKKDDHSQDCDDSSRKDCDRDRRDR
jgi:hypothetical protein